MTRDQLLDAFGSDKIPLEFVEECRRQQGPASALLLEFLTDFLNGSFSNDPDSSIRAEKSIFMVVHLLAEFKEPRAFPLLLELLERQPDWLEDILGDAISETLPGIMVNTFDGEYLGLHRLINNTRVSEFVRAAAFDAMAYLSGNNHIPLEVTESFLRRCHDQFWHEKLNFVWIGWVDCIATLGLESFLPLVEQAFNGGAIDPSIMNFFDFYDNLKSNIEMDGEKTASSLRGPIPFGSVDDLYTPEQRYASPIIASPSRSGHRNIPKLSPHPSVGRNDPCPCGSGKKYKKCCLL
ncbi:MAG: DUF1186 domain-containing protein [Magnetococcales bacterium]|nr:DUF1186 domain-containing protein [Magnetococcales bacterium]